jgi:hypothetical protein
MNRKKQEYWQRQPDKPEQGKAAASKDKAPTPI